VHPDRVTIIPNGIDVEEYRRTEKEDALTRYGIDRTVPFVLFVGRVTRQKGLVHLVRAIRHFNQGFGVVLCAGAPDTPAIAAEMTAAVEEARAGRPNVHWIAEMVDKPTLRQLYSHASVFVCPSVYEPFGIINLEAMACETPVVASKVGGIPEVVVDGETGVLVPIDPRSASEVEPKDPEQFARDLAAGINTLAADPAKRQAMARSARQRVEEHFSWHSIAQQTVDFYGELIARRRGGAGGAGARSGDGSSG
jgi:glycogen synthase